MLLNIVKAKAESGKDFPFEANLELSDDIINFKGYKFLSPVNVKGKMKYLSEKLFVKAKVSFKINAMCDNCGENFEKNINFDLDEVFVENYNFHNEEDYIINQNSVLIDKPIIDNLLSNVPSRMLCKKDCKGLCSICGKNKNFYSCNCDVLEDELERLDNPFTKIKK